MTSGKKLSGQKRAAALLAALGPELAAAVIKEFKSPYEVERVAYELSNLGAVSEDDTKDVLTECYQQLSGGAGRISGGVDVAREILKRAMGEQRAAAFISRAEASMAKNPFDFIKKGTRPSSRSSSEASTLRQRPSSWHTCPQNKRATYWLHSTRSYRPM